MAKATGKSTASKIIHLNAKFAARPPGLVEVIDGVEEAVNMAHALWLAVLGAISLEEEERSALASLASRHLKELERLEGMIAKVSVN